jgi:hypothetical protein
MKNTLPRISLRQTLFSLMCEFFARDKHEENVDVFKKVKGLRLKLYKFFQRLRWKEGERLEKKFKTNTYRPFFSFMDNIWN